VLAVGTFTVGTDSFVLNGLLPTIAADLHVSEATAGQLTTIFAATYAISSPLIAAFTGAFNRKWLLAGGLTLFTIGMAGQALGSTYALVAVARVLAAIGAVGFQSNAYVMAGAVASDAHRGRAFATVAGGMSVSTVLGVPIGVLAGQWFSWRAAMWGIGAAGLLVALAIPSLPTVRVQSAGLRDRLSVLVRPAVAKVLVVTVFGTVAMFTALVYLPLVVRPSATGTVLSWVFVAFGVGQVIGNTLAGRWTDRFGPDLVRLISLAGSAGTLALLDLAVLSLPSTIAIALAAGTSGGMLMVPQQHRLFSIAPDAPTVALGLNGSAMYAGGALGSAVGGAILANAGVGWLGPAAGVVALAGLALALTWPSRSPVPAG
jgi:predicted MFS family arabinose efflux permease